MNLHLNRISVYIYIKITLLKINPQFVYHSIITPYKRKSVLVLVG
jgi:hypothetical protein